VAEVSAISWTDSTFNPWIGCTKVGPGCDHCYAEALDKRHRWGGATHWGVGVPRQRTSIPYWKQPISWNKKAAESGKTWRVFCASLADVFDNDVPEQWRHDLWKLIGSTPALTWLLLTKRIGNAARMLPYVKLSNVWLGATIVNAEEAARDVPKLLETPATVHFVSYEPALGPVDWTKYLGIDWIIVGGESTQGAQARRFHVRMARDTIDQARAIGAAPFVKQLGSKPMGDYIEVLLPFKDRAGADPAEWPKNLRVQEFPQ
jgi:protein gp37